MAPHKHRACTNYARQWLWILACLSAWGLAAAALAQPASGSSPALPAARDLAADAQLLRARQIPLMILYSRPDCSWCERARREFLVPLVADPAAAERVLVRQVDLDSAAPLTDFAGRITTHGAFAKARQVMHTPTLMFYDQDGSQVASPIQGFLLADYYGAIVERRIDEGLAQLREAKP